MMATAPAPDPRRSEQSARGRHMQSAVYGTILALSLIAVLSEHEEKPLRVMASLLATQLVFYIAHVYAADLGLRVDSERRPTWRQARAVLTEEWPLLAAAGPLALVLFVGGISPFNDRIAIASALAVGVGTLGLYGIRLGIAEGRSFVGIAVVAGFNSALGLVLVALKVLVH